MKSADKLAGGRQEPAAGSRLVYTSDSLPGYSRIRRGRGFSFISPDGVCVIDRSERARILALAIPPAYENAWICTIPNGHLQATGFDARKRKQYRYHPMWHEKAGVRKMRSLSEFVRALPAIRTRLARYLADDNLSKDRIIAGIVLLLDLTGYRIGNARYARENRTFGIASLLARHLAEEDGHLILKFRGKAGNAHRAEIIQPRLAQLIGELQHLPGQHLFRYEDDLGELHDIDSSDVNEWLKEAGGGDFSAKQFRTWRANLLCARELAADPPPSTEKERKRAVRLAIETTAKELNHTPATCRKYYLHPTLFAAYHSGRLFTIMHSRAPAMPSGDPASRLHADERRLVKALKL